MSEAFASSPAALTPIGVVRSPIADRKQMTTLGVPAAVEIFEPYLDGLLHIEKHTHLWVLAWLEGANRVTQVTPRGVAEGPEGMHGVFAVRSPARPNPIGLTAARVTSRAANRIEFDRLDFVDGTPVVDLKPYFVTRDLIFSARNKQVGRNATKEAIREALLMQGEAFVGSVDAAMEQAAGVLADFRSEVLGFVDPVWWQVSVPASRLDLADAFQAMTRVRLGDGSLRLEGDSIVLRAGGCERSYSSARTPFDFPRALK
ncbi:MAG: tRNA (N6-threonylcarbamoyladenosine(37)-N6)-methyltransferase TrmO [Bryobacteraceae bacterium]